MSYPPKYITINIQKPIWSGEGVFEVGIRDTYVRKAQRLHKDLRITIPQGETIVSTNKIYKEGVKRPFVGRFPNNPMTFYYIKLYFDKKTPPEDLTIPLSIKERLREVWFEKYA
jgi:hypothetical protein